MYIYNVTTHVTWDIHDEWLQWVRDEYIPQILALDCFTHHQLLRLTEIDETDGPTYAIQYFVESKALYNRFMDIHSEKFRQLSFAKWGDKYIAFGSVMQIVQ